MGYMKYIETSSLLQGILDAVERERLDKHYRKLAEKPYPESTFPFMPPTPLVSTPRRVERVIYVSPTIPTH